MSLEKKTVHTRIEGGLAMDLILTGRTISVAEAKNLGLISQIEKSGQLPSGVERLIGELNQLSPEVLRLTRRTLWRLHADHYEEQLAETERIYFDTLIRTEDTREGIQAFLEKRTPLW
jgi:enoyl-CoA hydratase/carnithine racemase